MPNTTIIKPDRVTFSPLTADPSSCVAGDTWVRTDTGQLKFAIDTVVANAKVTVEAPIETSELADGAVTEAKIGAGAVTEGKIAANAVTGGKIAAGAVGATQLADSAVSTAKIADGQVTDAKVASGISPGKIGTGNMNLGTGTLTAGEISVGDLSMQYGWRITETPDELLFVKDGRVIGRVTKAGFVAR